MCKEYKDKSGIYGIVNKVNGKCYIGQAVDVYVRKGIHYSALRGNRHYNKHLQRAWNKYGEENFTHTVLGYCEVDELDQLEIDYIDFFDTTDDNKGYNKTLGGGGTRGKKLSEEQKKKISESNKGKKRSEETRKNISLAKTGVKFSEERRKQISEYTTGEKHPMYGKQHSEESKQKMSEAHIGKTLSEEHRNVLSLPVVQLTKQGEFIAEYFGAKEAGRILGVNSGHITGVCKGRKNYNTAGGYKWMYASEYKIS